MPNALAHIGLQWPLTRLALGRADLKWIALGCLLPDLPWILQRAVHTLLPAVDPFELRLYATVQASLAFSLLPAAALALCARRRRRTAILLGANVLFHLVLDACQVKWGNGVHFMAPFSWRMTGWDLFWPESLFSLLATVAGLGVLAAGWRAGAAAPADLVRPGRRGMAAVGLLLGIYFAAPPFLAAGPLAADNHFVATLGAGAGRTGRPVAFDRVPFERTAGGGSLRTWGGERLRLEGVLPPASGRVSLRGEFTTPERVRVREFHVHAGPWRDLASLAGIGLTALLWASALRGERRRRGKPSGTGPDSGNER